MQDFLRSPSPRNIWIFGILNLFCGTEKVADDEFDD
jgi:hypothetical protein